MSTGFGDIIHLNVGGKRFSTSRQTLTWIPDTFFTAILSGRISTLHDENGAIFIDRDPSLFKPILNYLRTKDINIQGSEEYQRELKHEAEFYAIMPLVRRLTLCEDLNYSSCGNLLFCGCLNPPPIPLPEGKKIHSDIHQNHSRHSSLDLRLDAGGPEEGRNTLPRNHSRSSSLDMRWNSVRLSGSSQNQLAAWFGGLHVHSMVDPLRVNIIRAHHNWILVAYAHAITCYKFKDSSGWQLVFVSPYMEAPIDRAALNARLSTTQSQNAAAQAQGPEASSKMVAFASKAVIRLWSISEEGIQNDIGTFNMHAPVESLFFIGSQLVALSKAPIGKIGVWHSMTQHWQIQDVTPVTSYDTAGSFLLLGCSNGAICYIDMQKFPLRMKDNDLLVTELYRDPSQDAITAISVYLTPKTRMTGNWIEIAYGTSSGTVRVIVQHPETVGHGPQLFQTFTVHRSPVTKVRLSEKYLVSVCSEYNHVRTWSVTRFRGMISTQPGSTPMASFKILALDEAETAAGLYAPHNDCGPYGEQDEEQLFVQKVVPDTDQLFVRFASNGKRVCSIKSVDGTMITSLCVHECEGSSRMGSRPRRILFTGHSNGIVQIWDLSTALDLATKGEPATRMVGGPTSSELLRLLDHCDVVVSAGTTPASTPTPAGASALNSAGARVKTSNLAILSQFQRNRSSSDRT